MYKASSLNYAAFVCACKKKKTNLAIIVIVFFIRRNVHEVGTHAFLGKTQSHSLPHWPPLVLHTYICQSLDIMRTITIFQYDAPIITLWKDATWFGSDESIRHIPCAPHVCRFWPNFVHYILSRHFSFQREPFVMWKSAPLLSRWRAIVPSFTYVTRSKHIGFRGFPHLLLFDTHPAAAAGDGLMSVRSVSRSTHIIHAMSALLTFERWCFHHFLSSPRRPYSKKRHCYSPCCVRVTIHSIKDEKWCLLS